ncbi:MAG: hypothetical protein JO356_16985 [Acidobacteria bacterium]|nr:hypothetical protein [Acidobacteriota bacterium]
MSKMIATTISDSINEKPFSLCIDYLLPLFLFPDDVREDVVVHFVGPLRPWPYCIRAAK